jgi:group I intron endonuclease
MPYKSGVYKIENKNNGRVYIGSAVDFKKRWRQHRNDLNSGRHHSQKLQRAWNKYGEDAFVFAVVEIVFDESELLTREQAWIDFWDSSKHGYNISPTAGNCRGVVPSEAARAHMSEAQRRRGKRKPHSEESKRKMSIALKGRVISESARAAISRAHKGRAKSPTECQNISKGKKGKHLSEEHCKALSTAHTGKGNALKTHCPHGHPYSTENTYFAPKTGYRQCLTCIRARIARRAAYTLAKKLRMQLGMDVEIQIPPAQGSDWADGFLLDA